MAEKLRIDIISDVVCPWCIIGFQRLTRAIEELGAEDKVTIVWQPFQLNPHIPPEGENLREHLAKKYGTSTAESVHARSHLTQLGAEIGFQFDYFDEMKTVNTRDAHILLGYASEFGKQTELAMRLFSAFFSERKDISNRSVLSEALTAVGLDTLSALSKLDDPQSINELEATVEQLRQLGVSSVPTVVFNQTDALTGAQPVEVYKQLLEEFLSTSE